MDFNYNKEINNKENKITINFHGEKKEWNTNTEQANYLLDKLLNYYKYEDFNLNDAIKYIRTILKDFNELELEVTYEYKKEKEYVIYSNKKIKEYEKVNKDINISFKNNSFRINKISDDLSLLTVSNEINKELRELNNIKEIKLDTRQKLLIQLYKIIYKKNPDFTNIDTFHEMNFMMCILYDLRINIAELYIGGYDYKFYNMPQYGREMLMPASKKFMQEINEFYIGDSLDYTPFGIIELNNEEEVRLNGKVLIALDYLSEIINNLEYDNNLNNKIRVTNLNERLERILLLCSVIRIKGYRTSDMYPDEYVSYQLECSEELTQPYIDYTNKIIKKCYLKS